MKSATIQWILIFLSNFEGKISIAKPLKCSELVSSTCDAWTFEKSLPSSCAPKGKSSAMSIPLTNDSGVQWLLSDFSSAARKCVDILICFRCAFLRYNLISTINWSHSLTAMVSITDGRSRFQIPHSPHAFISCVLFSFVRSFVW